MQLEQKIEHIIEPAIYDLGFEIVRVQLSGNLNPRLQIMAEPVSDQEMTVDHCAMISKTISALLDVDDPIQGAYTLEISSPGLDRPLVKLRDYMRFIGCEARIETLIAIDGRKRFRGRLRDVKDSTIIISVDCRDRCIPYSSVRRAKLLISDDQFSEQKL